MINHLSIGVRDIPKAKTFYDATLQPLGYRCLSQAEDMLGYGAESPVLWLLKSTHPVVEHDQSGLHICFDAPARASVKDFHRAAIKAGGRDNGTPGVRS